MLQNWISDVDRTCAQPTTLQVLQEIEAESAEAETAADPFPVAPNRGYSSVGWGVRNVDGTKVDKAAVSLFQLQQALGMPMVEVWLGLLLKGQDEYELEQRGDFYSPQGIWVRNRRTATVV